MFCDIISHLTSQYRPDFFWTFTISGPDYSGLWRLLIATNRNVTDGIKVGPEHFGVAKDVVTERVQPIQGEPNVRGSDPVLQLLTALEVVGTGPTLQGTEGDRGATQRRDVTELIGAERDGLITFGNRFIDYSFSMCAKKYIWSDHRQLIIDQHDFLWLECDLLIFFFGGGRIRLLLLETFFVSNEKQRKKYNLLRKGVLRICINLSHFDT